MGVRNKAPVDMGETIAVVNDCMERARDLDGEYLRPDGDPRSEQANINRGLLSLADRLSFAAALVRETYWQRREERDDGD